MSKRLIVILAVMVLAFAFLSACAPKAECTDAIGCVEVKSGDPIHIAYAMVIAGPDATLGIDSRNGAEIAIDERGGKLLGHDIQFDGEDDGCSAEGGQAAASRPCRSGVHRPSSKAGVSQPAGSRRASYVSPW